MCNDLTHDAIEYYASKSLGINVIINEFNYKSYKMLF
jgi:hypothetical protein